LISEKLDKVESLLTSEPDSALLLIEGIDLESIHKEKIKARHALLYSIIMDKRHVDIKSDSLIRPALEYYPRHGDCQETAMTFYYTARIYENADDLELAMKYLVKAESIRSNKDPYLNSLIHSAKGRIYNHLSMSTRWQRKSMESLHLTAMVMKTTADMFPTRSAKRHADTCRMTTAVHKRYLTSSA
jgi:hypothetical protein